MFFSENIILLLWLAVSTSLKLGDECVESTSGLDGTCQFYWDCNYGYKHRQKPEYCDGINGLITCCPPVELRISEEMCLEYHSDFEDVDDIEISTSNDTDNIQFPEPHIVRGTKTDLREHRHMAAIGFTENYRIKWACGGSIISPFFILSAAHCVEDRQFGKAKWVRIGDLDLQNSTEGANPLDLRIVESFKHPNYISTSHYNDIALFKLEKKIEFGDDYQPACLHTEKNLPQKLEATGWGQIGFLEDPSPHLQKVDLNVVEYEKCAAKYRDHRKLPNGVMDETQICAGDSSGKDTCGGDSGGPLHYKLEKFLQLREHYVVAGITAYGKGCGSFNSSSVYTRVSAYLDWIEEIVWKNESEPETEE